MPYYSLRPDNLNILGITHICLLRFHPASLSLLSLQSEVVQINFHQSRKYSPNKTLLLPPHSKGRSSFPGRASCKLEVYQWQLSRNGFSNAFPPAQLGNPSFKKTLTKSNALEMSLGASNSINLFVLWYFTVSQVRDFHFNFFLVCSFR